MNEKIDVTPAQKTGAPKPRFDVTPELLKSNFLEVYDSAEAGRA